ncbi:MAG: PIG-L family deacetylase [Anaerolineae bacterium]|nr:PIG-L family deacetylase [Anaerolineae bacterium]
MPENENENATGGIMVIGAHAGDAENMAGATVLKHTRAGHAATIVHMTLGEAGHPTLAPELYAEQRRREVQASAALMGARAVCLPYRDGELPVSDDVKLEACDLIRRQKPGVILTHWKGSFHKDHVATHEIVRDAIFYAALPAIRRELPPHSIHGLYYPENWEDMEGWSADLYLDASDVWDEYLEVLRSHELMGGRIWSFRYLEYYDALGTTRGCLGGFRKAVALMAPWLRVRRLAYLPGLEPAGAR